MHIIATVLACIGTAALVASGAAAKRREEIRRLNRIIDQRDRQIQNLRRQLSDRRMVPLQTIRQTIRPLLAELEKLFTQVLQYPNGGISRLRLNPQGRLIEEP